MNAISKYQFGNHPVRIVMRGEEPWFVALDICSALGYANSRKAVADHLDDDEKGVTTSDTLGGKQSLTIINESGLYALVLRSRKPEARKFAKWVTGEVLPSIRKTGRYSVQQQPELFHAGQYETLNQLLARLAKQLAEPNGYSVITFMPLYEVICQKLGHSPRYVERLPELLADPGFDIEPQLLSQINQASHQRLMQKLADAYEGMEMLGTAIRRIKGPKLKALPA